MAVDSSRCLQSQMKVTNKQLFVGPISIPLLSFREIFILAVGKASALMMRAALRTLVDFPLRGILVAPKDPRIPRFDNRIETFLSGHPIPNHVGLRASQRVIQAVDSLAEDHLLLCLISGGASALLPAPAEGITIQDKIAITHQLIRSGANIHEINTIRRHLSQLKGGRLVEMCRAGEIVSMIISDVPGNHLPDIGSGLTVEDPTSYQDAVEILKRRDQWRETPLRVKEHLRKGVRGAISETPKPGSASFQRVHNLIIADNNDACKAAQRSLEERRVPCTILSTSAELEARDMGKLLAAFASKPKHSSRIPIPRGAILIGGECSIQVAGKGKGGRNQVVVLSAVEEIKGLDGTVIAALGTDGIDGNSKAAGAIADGNTAQRARRRKLDPTRFLARDDSGTFFRRLGDSLVTSSTGTNVGDIYLMISLC